MTQSKPPTPDPSPRSGGINVGDQTAQGNVTTHLENVAGRDQISHSQVVQHAENVYLVQKPGFLEKPGFSPLQLPLDEIPKPTSLPPGSRMLMGLNPHFVGRERELKQLAQVLQTGDTAAIGQMATITGLGGVGKSQLAIAFAHHYGPLFDGGVFWLNMSDGANVPAELAQCGYAMPLGDGYEGLTLDEQVRRVQMAWQETIPRLLLFDNCEDETLLAQWRPKTGGCRVLVTSRRAAWDVSLGVATLPLDTLTPPESRALLQNLAPHLSDPDADAIAEELGHLPLALHLAGSYLHTYRHAPLAQPAAYLAELQNERLEHPSLQGEGTSYSPTDHERHVGRTFALSLERLNPAEPVDQLALALLARAAHFAPGTPIPRALLLASAGVNSDNRTDQLRGEKAMARLVGLGLLTVEATTGWPIIHRLVAAFTQMRKVDEEAQAQVEETVNDEAYRLNMAGYPRALLPWQGQLRHVTEQALLREDETAATLATNLGYHLKALGEYAAARSLYERTVAVFEKTLGLDHPNVAISLNNLAELLHNLGEYAAALPLYERALVIREHALGPDHPSTATGLNNLAELLRSMGDYPSARPLYERALLILEKSLGADHPNIATSLNNLALLLKSMGEYMAARPLYERVLAIDEKALGPDHPNLASDLNNLAVLLMDTGDYMAARPILERSLAIWEKSMGADHPFVAISLNNLSRLLQNQGEYATARPILERSLLIQERALGPDHPHVAANLNNLAGLLYNMGEYAAAHPLYERALAIDEKALGPNHPDVASSLNNLALLLKNQGEYAAARPLYERSLAIREHALGPDHPDVANSLNNLALLLRNQGEYAASRPLYERALAIIEHSLGPDHPNVATSLNNLAALLRNQGETRAARPLYERALAIFTTKLGPDHPNTRTVRNNLASLGQ